MSMPGANAVVRTLRRFALLAAGSSVLAACTSRSYRIPLPATDARWVAPATAESDGPRPANPALDAAVARASGSAVPPTVAVLCGGAQSGGGHSVGSPGRVDPWKTEFGAGGCDLRRWPGAMRTEKSYAIAAADILGYQFLLNQFDRHFISYREFGSDLESIRRNLSGGWTYDEDPFRMNQFLHPYGGAIYHGFARSAGLDFWESFGYDVVASAIWEIAGERTPPSINDQITTSIAGCFLGEALFRSANLMLEGARGRPSSSKELGAALVSPSTGFNRIAYGDRFDAVYPSHDPAVFSSWGAGLRRYTTLTDTGVQAGLNPDVAVGTVSVDYGLPGKRGYSYDRPFDYFHLDATATTNEEAIPETVSIRGLLLGDDYSHGHEYRGIWGLYGNYDYFSPQVFKLSSTALSLGTTGQYLVSHKLALQGSVLAGVGFTATGTTANERAERSYRYSVSPQALVALRAVYGDVAMLDVTANEYFLADSIESTRATRSENVVRAQVSLTVRVAGCHAIGLGFTHANRDARFEGFIDVPQSVNSVTLFYTHLGDTNFGVVRR
jgi:hypothetical protein